MKPEIKIDVVKKRNGFKTTKAKSSESAINRIESFEIVEIKTCLDEFRNFRNKIEEMKQELSNDQKDLSRLILYTPIMDYPSSITKTMNINLNIRFNNVIDPNKRFQAANLLVSLNATVETIVYNVLTLFNIEDLNTSKYLLKIHGLEEYLPCYSTLSELTYIHECLNENREPVLVLTELQNANIDLAQNKGTLDMNKFAFSGLDDLNKHIVSKSKLENVLKTMIQNRNSLESSIMTEENMSVDSILNWLIELKEKLKYLKVVLFDISHDCVEAFINRLELSEKKILQYRNSRQLKEKEPLIMTLNPEYSYRVETSSSSSSSSNLEVFLKSMLDLVNSSMQDVFSFLNCAGFSFLWPFKFNSMFNKNLNRNSLNLKNNEIINETHEILEVIQAEEKFSVLFKGISRLSHLIGNVSTTLK